MVEKFLRGEDKREAKSSGMLHSKTFETKEHYSRRCKEKCFSFGRPRNYVRRCQTSFQYFSCIYDPEQSKSLQWQEKILVYIPCKGVYEVIFELKVEFSYGNDTFYLVHYRQISNQMDLFVFKVYNV